MLACSEYRPAYTYHTSTAKGNVARDKMFVKPEKLRYLRATKASNSISGVLMVVHPCWVCCVNFRNNFLLLSKKLRALSLIIICAFGKMKNDRNNEPGYIVEYRYEINLRS